MKREELERQSSLRQMASELLSLSLLEICPSATIVETMATKWGFFVDVILPFPLHADYMRLIEERMWQKIKAKNAFYVTEMVPTNAKQFLIHHKQRMRAETIDLDEPLVYVVSLGPYVNVSPIKPMAELSSIQALSLEEPIAIEEKIYHKKAREVVRIQGVAFETKEELKEFRKRQKEMKGRDHLVNGEEWDLFHSYEGEILWKEEGILLREAIEKKTIHFLKENGFERIGLEGALWEERESLLPQFEGKKRQSTGLLFFREGGDFGLKDALQTEIVWGVSIFFKNEKEYNGSFFLPMIEEWGRLFGISGEIEENKKGPKWAKLWSMDLYGLFWEMASLEVVKRGDVAYIELKMYLDRVLAFIMEEFPEKELLKKRLL